MAAILAFALISSGCNALKRGDYKKQTDESALLQEIGFRVADNAGFNDTLPTDAVYRLKVNESVITINVPYVTDTTVPLRVYFKTLGSDENIRVGQYTGPNPEDISVYTSGVTQFIFNVADIPQEFSIRLVAYSSGGEVKEVLDYTLKVNKVFYPVLLNPYHAQQVNPLHLRIGFVDEKGDPINTDPALGNWNNTSKVEWDHILLDLEDTPDPLLFRYSGPPDDPGHYIPGLLPLPDGWEIIARPLTPQEHKIFLPAKVFSDEDGYDCSGLTPLDPNKANTPVGTFIRFTYDPPPVYLSNRVGNDLNDGLTKSTPVATFGRAVFQLGDLVLTNLYIEGSATPYDTDGHETIGGGLPVFSVFGGFRPGFNERYAPNDESANARTVLVDTNQGAGGDMDDPSGVLVYDGVSNDFVLDQVTIESHGAWVFSSALVLRNDSKVNVHNSLIVAPQADQTGCAALSAVAIDPGPGPRITSTQFIGTWGATVDSRSVYTDNADLSFEGCLILGGEGDAVVRGIEAHNTSQIILSWSAVQSGLLYDNDSVVNVHEELENTAIWLDNSGVNLNNVLVEAWNASDISRAVYSEVDTGNELSFINASTLVSQRANESVAVDFVNNNASQLRLFNSVILANENNGAASTNIAAGVRLFDVDSALIMSNAIRVRRGANAENTAGVKVASSQFGADADIINNLIWSQNTDDFRAVQGTAGPGNIRLYEIAHNNIWNDDDTAGMDVGDGLGFQSLPIIHSNNVQYPSIDGNVSIEVDVRTSYSLDTYFDSGWKNLGQVQDTVPEDIRFGGRDLTLVVDYPYGWPVEDKRDRTWEPRTGNGNTGVYWSIGPHEFDDIGEPWRIHVALPTNGGDDGHPLGSAERPFATPGRAYQAARTASPARTNVEHIRIAGGTYDLDAGVAMPTINIAGLGMLAIEGGWNSSFTSHNPSSYETVLTRGIAAPVLVMDTNNVQTGFAIRSLTLENSLSSTAVTVQNGAAPTIDNCIIRGSNQANSTALLVANWAGPVVRGNDITAGSAPNVWAVRMSSPGSGTSLEWNDITLGAGTSSYGISVDSGDPVSIRNNVLTGGSASNLYGIWINATPGSYLESNDITLNSSTISSYGVYVMNTGTFTITNNRIRGGTSTTESYGLYMLNPAGPATVSGNRISGGTADRTWGVRAENPTALFLTENSVFGGDGVLQTRGIALENPVNSRLVNNIVHGGAYSTVENIGIYMNNGNDTLLYSNSVHGGSSGGLSAAIRATGTNHQFVNNFIMAGSGVDPASSFGFMKTDAAPMFRFYHNLFVGTAPGNHVPYGDGAAIEISDIPSLDLLLGPISQGNVIDFTGRPTDYLKNFGAPVTGDQFMAVDWHLKTSSPSGARTGGYNLGLDGFYAYSWDRDWKTRTAPWSIGAYEY